MPAFDGLIAYEDFTPGEVTTYGRHRVTREEVIEFAAAFDPQPMHLDEAAGKASILGGLAASGWHTCAMLMRMNCDHFLNASTSRGGPGLEEVKWVRPVFPDDVLTVRCEILDKRVSASRPDLGIVRFRFDVTNQKDELVLVQINPIFFARRAEGPA